jgi:hypothetical protein
MNATSLNELRAAQAADTSVAPDAVPGVTAGTGSASTGEDVVTATADARMEQIRQLLLGDSLALNAERLQTLERRHAEFEKLVLHRLDLISQRLDALSRDVLADRRAAFDELARAVQELGSRVRGI